MVLGYGSFTAEWATVSQKFVQPDGFFTALPFTPATVTNLSVVAAQTTTITLSGMQNNASIFTTASVDYPTLMPISYAFSSLSSYFSIFSDYQCLTTCKSVINFYDRFLNFFFVLSRFYYITPLLLFFVELLYVHQCHQLNLHPKNRRSNLKQL